MRATAVAVAIGCPLALSGCIFNMWAQVPLWPKVQNQYPHPVQYEVAFTNGSTHVEMVGPCGNRSLWAKGERFVTTGWAKPNRKVFVKRLTIRKDGAVIAEFDGEEIERPWREEYAFAVIDETGLRAIPSITKCFLVLNTLAEDIQARVEHKDGAESLRAWKACEPAIWADRDLVPLERKGNRVERLVVARAGKALHRMERAEFRELIRGRWAALLAVDESGIRVVPDPYRYFRPGGDVRSLCAAGD